MPTIQNEKLDPPLTSDPRIAFICEVEAALHVTAETPLGEEQVIGPDGRTISEGKSTVTQSVVRRGVIA